MKPLLMRGIAAFTALVLSACVTIEDNLPDLNIVTVHDAPGKSKGDVCRSARDWAAFTFRDSKAVIEVFDLEAGTMIGKGRFILSGHMGTPFPVDFTLRVDCRDGRARSTFTEYLLDVGGGRRVPLTREDSLNKLRTQTEARTADMVRSLGAAVASSAKSDF